VAAKGGLDALLSEAVLSGVARRSGLSEATAMRKIQEWRWAFKIYSKGCRIVNLYGE
jgi:hypothetical protein